MGSNDLGADVHYSIDAILVLQTTHHQRQWTQTHTKKDTDRKSVV